VYRQGYSLHAADKRSDAAGLFEQSVELAREAGCEVCEMRSLTNLGGSHVAASRHREALDAFLRAKRIAERTGDRESAGAVALNLSNLYLHRYALEEAAGASGEAMAALTPSTPAWLRIKVLTHQARLLARRGNMKDAALLFTQVVEEASRAGDTASEALAWELLGLERLRRSELAAAEAALVESYRLRRAGDRAGLAAAYHSLAMLRLEQGNARSAVELAGRAIEHWRRSPSIRPLWQIRLTRGQALAAAGRDGSALADFDAALEQVRMQRLDAMPADALRVSYGAGTQDVYAGRIGAGNRLALSTRNYRLIEEGLSLAEESRALGLRHASGEWRAAQAKLPPAYFEELSRLQALFAGWQREKKVDGRKQVEAVRRRLVEMEATAGLTVRGSAESQQPFQRSTLGPDEALLSFHVGPTESYLWAATRDGVELTRLPGRAELASQIAEFVRRIQAGGPEATTHGERLWSVLFGDTGEKVRSRRQWLLSLDGVLFDLPFAALVVDRRESEPVYLAERHTVQLIPGAWALGPRVREDAPERWTGPMLALGDPIYNVADRRWTGHARADVPEAALLPRLVGSGREARASIRAWGEGFMLDGLRAGWDELREETVRLQPEVLHLATHYIESPDDPRQVLMALGLNRRGLWQVLGPEQIASLRIASRLVVMSGCGSGSGPDVAGEGRVGLARAWLRSGAAAVAATYWPTTDETGALIEVFYRRLRSSARTISPFGPAEALRLAQLDMIQQGSWMAEPRYWASYFVLGKN
jgi:CHAT domain-containing protein/tetratricopeptide (TPR) repeat protein